RPWAGTDEQPAHLLGGAPRATRPVDPGADGMRGGDRDRRLVVRPGAPGPEPAAGDREPARWPWADDDPRVPGHADHDGTGRGPRRALGVPGAGIFGGRGPGGTARPAAACRTGAAHRRRRGVGGGGGVRRWRAGGVVVGGVGVGGRRVARGRGGAGGGGGRGGGGGGGGGGGWVEGGVGGGGVRVGLGGFLMASAVF